MPGKRNGIRLSQFLLSSVIYTQTYPPNEVPRLSLNYQEQESRIIQQLLEEEGDIVESVQWGQIARRGKLVGVAGCRALTKQ